MSSGCVVFQQTAVRKGAVLALGIFQFVRQQPASHVKGSCCETWTLQPHQGRVLGPRMGSLFIQSHNKHAEADPVRHQTETLNDQFIR